MKDGSVFKVAGLFAILLGLAKIVSPILYVLMDPNLHAEMPAKVFLPAFADHPDLLLAFFWTEALVGVFGLAIIQGVNGLVKGKNDGWINYGGNLALVGYGVSTVGYLLSIARLPLIAKTFVTDPTAQPVLTATWKASIDLLGFWGYAAIGLWILFVSITALQHNAYPKWLAWLGIVLAVPHLLVPFGTYFKSQAILTSVLVIGLLAPVWYLAMGVRLRRQGDQVIKSETA
jgi:Domain of unknown function (DUF4386)